MSKDMLGSLTRALVSVPQKWLGLMLDIANKLNGEARDNEAFFSALAKFVRDWRTTVDVVKDSVLTLVTTMRLDAQPGFVARDHFKVGVSGDIKVRIAYIWPDFEKHFLGKIEEETIETELAVRTLDKDLLDKEIRAELGAEKEETTLSQFWALLEKQGSGQDEVGPLLTNGYANIFYIRDAEGTLWAVHAYWHADDGGWGVRALSVSFPFRWRAGHQVVSRN